MPSPRLEDARRGRARAAVRAPLFYPISKNELSRAGASMPLLLTAPRRVVRRSIGALGNADSMPRQISRLAARKPRRSALRVLDAGGALEASIAAERRVGSSSTQKFISTLM